MVGICPNAAMFRSIGWFPGPCDIFASIHYRKLLASALGSCAKFRPVLSAVPLTQPPLSEVYAIPKCAPAAALDTEMQEAVGPLFGMATPRKTRLIERREQVARKRIKHYLAGAH